MGTYTTNYNLFIPTIGEQGWGELVNGNFSTIDTTMKSLSNRTTALESVIQVDGNQNVTFPGSVTVSGNMNANINLTFNVSYNASSGTFGHSCGKNSAAPVMVLSFSPFITYTGVVQVGANYSAHYGGSLYCITGSNSTGYTITVVSASDILTNPEIALPDNCHGAWFHSSMGYWVRYPIFTLV